MTDSLRFAEPADAPRLYAVIQRAFAARPTVDPPAEASSDTVDDVYAALERGYGVLVERDDVLIAGLLIAVEGDLAWLRRVAVVPEAAGAGVGHQLVTATICALAEFGYQRARVIAREEFPQNVRLWERHGFVKTERTATGWVLECKLPIAVRVPDAEAMRGLGRRLAASLRKGDVIVATGDLGAGKTTLAQGIGAGLSVEGPVISPTFVLSRVHKSLGDGPAFVHVDAYRLGSADELADIDLQETQASAVTLVEWGEGLAEWMSEEPLQIHIQRSDDPADDERIVLLCGQGARWQGVLESIRELA